MESWSYGPEGKGFVLSGEAVPPTDARARSGKTSCNYGNAMLVDREAIENQGFMELGFPEIIRKPLPDNPNWGFLGGNIGTERVASPSCLVTPEVFSREEYSSRLSRSVVDSDSRDSSLIDLKLGRLADCGDAQYSKSSKEMPVSSSMVLSVPAKRARTILTSQTPFCQVRDCNMDLSSSKDYHKKHKVCDIHSKTAKVIVNGIEQRFCQQCSRFHLLAEFDDGKRSCRKRLAGHNERRRKPQLDNHSVKNTKLLLSYHGSRFPGTSLPARTSFICPDIFPSGILHPVRHETSNWCGHVKLENEAIYNSQSVIPITNKNSIPKSFLPPYGLEKQHPSLHGNGSDTPGSFFYKNSYQYPHDLASPNSVSRSLFQYTSSGSEDFTVSDTASTIQVLSGVSDSSCALSLLSSQSQNSSSHSSGIPMAQSLIIQGGHAHYSMGQFPKNLLRVSSQASTSEVSNRFSSSGINSVEVDHLGPVLVSDASNAVDFEVHMDGIFQRSDFVNAKDPISHEHGTTVDLLQLSSQLQCVERQRHSAQVKQENDVFCCLPIT